MGGCWFGGWSCQWEEKERLLTLAAGWKKDNGIAGGDISGLRGSQEKGAAVFCILLVAGSHSGWLVERGAVLWWLTAERGLMAMLRRLDQCERKWDERTTAAGLW
ncbi:hypothetical protein NC653_039667 [Populus alba x Populus x berolinensis]|uniref:Uncharacterized protein n=1 Tax=Populus alba x Populus x berolinensis TaxID=444605 RepID=A0AAD6LED6_9ROSI|nr:hypothetical protein NC653_039667 [Populus alba x Populus x berolinensis]